MWILTRGRKLLNLDRVDRLWLAKGTTTGEKDKWSVYAQPEARGEQQCVALCDAKEEAAACFERIVQFIASGEGKLLDLSPRGDVRAKKGT